MNLQEAVFRGLPWAQRVIALATVVRDRWKSAKSGPEKALIVRDAITNRDGDDAIEVLEGVTGRDFIDDERLAKLAEESTELGYQGMKIVDRLKAIESEIKAIKAARVAGPAGPGAVAE